MYSSNIQEFYTFYQMYRHLQRQEQPNREQPFREPIREQLIREQQSIREQPIREQPIREQHIREQPIREQPIREQPIRQPFREQPIRQPITDLFNVNNQYDSYGNMSSLVQPQQSTGSIIGRFVLQTISNVMHNAVRQISNEIEANLFDSSLRSPSINDFDSVLHPELSDPEHYEFVIMPYKNMVNKKEHTSCPICFDEYEQNSMILSTSCLHFFHEDCLKKWVQTDQNHSCPICRTKL